MELLLEQLVIYGGVGLFCLLVIAIYLRSLKKASIIVEQKVAKAKMEGIHEPLSLHPVIDLNTCIGSAACIAACPEKDILGVVDGKATIVNASNCVGHGACFHSCPVEAISLCIGTEKRGVELPHVHSTYETNIKGIYIAGELGGMGLIKNSVEQGQLAVENMIKSGIPKDSNSLDLIIVGAGPAGIAASLTARKNNLTFRTFEQDSLGGTVFTFPRAKVVMTSPMELPFRGKVKLFDTSKTELLELWQSVLSENQIEIEEHTKVEAIIPVNGGFKVKTSRGDEHLSKNVLIAIGRRGSPRKLDIPGEDLEKVAYRLLEPEHIEGKKVMVVGGGDSAIESALLLADQNEVILSYRKETFSRLKPKNKERIQEAIEQKTIQMEFSSSLVSIEKDSIHLSVEDGKEIKVLPNDLVYIFAGGELPTQFLQNAGIEITKRFGYAMKTYKKRKK